MQKIDPEQFAQLESYSWLVGIPLKRLINDALADYLVVVVASKLDEISQGHA